MRIPKPDIPSLWARSCPYVLIGCWLFGLVAGILTALASEEVLVPLILRGVSMPTSASGMLLVGILPFLLSAYAIYFSEPWLLLIFSIGKSFSFAFCACGISLAFGQSSWLVRFLFLFSDILLMPLLLIYWLRHIRGNTPVKRMGLMPYLFTAGIVCWLDYRFIAPLLVSVMNR